jgi:amino acid transporter
MLKLKHNQAGFIPMIICLILLIAAVLYVSYHYVAQAQH